MSEQRDLSTAHEAWEQRWADASQRADWLVPEQPVVSSVPFLHRYGAKTVVDIGCGVGRHALYLAEQGFDVTGVDLSPRGLDVAREAADGAGLPVDFKRGSFTDLPISDQSVDVALAWNVIYHGDGEIARQALSEIRRVLRPGGFLLATMISKRHHRYGEGKEIRPGTFIIDDGDDEKAHAHFYCDERELIGLLDGFRLYWLQDREQREPGTWHWEFLTVLESAT